MHPPSFANVVVFTVFTPPPTFQCIDPPHLQIHGAALAPTIQGRQEVEGLAY